MNGIKKFEINIFKKLNHFSTFCTMLSVFLFLLFLTPLSPVLADGFNKGGGDFRGFENREGNYGDNGFQGGERGDRGNGPTGGLAALLLVLANATVFLSLILKGINRFFSSSPETKKSISAFNQAQKKYLRGIHYYLNPIAICIAFVHFHLSTCRSILPDAALILFLIIGALGLILKFKLSPKNMYKAVYGLHCSSITFSLVILLLVIGHA